MTYVHPSLFDGTVLDPTLAPADGRSHHDDPETSRAAARSVAVRTGTMRHRVLIALAQAGVEGHTDSELGAILRCRETSAGTRRGELEREGLVERTERTRPTAYGNPALVHVITEAGRDLLAAIARQENP